MAWLNLRQLAGLFRKDVRTKNEHIQTIYKDYWVQGYAINEKRLEQKQQEVQTLKDGIRILSRAMEEKRGVPDLDWLNQFAKGLEILDDYDHEKLDAKGLSKKHAIYPGLQELTP